MCFLTHLPVHRYIIFIIIIAIVSPRHGISTQLIMKIRWKLVLGRKNLRRQIREREAGRQRFVESDQINNYLFIDMDSEHDRIV